MSRRSSSCCEPAFPVEVVEHPAGDRLDDAADRLAFVGKIVIVPFGQLVEKRLVAPVLAEIVEEGPNSQGDAEGDAMQSLGERAAIPLDGARQLAQGRLNFIDSEAHLVIEWDGPEPLPGQLVLPPFPRARGEGDIRVQTTPDQDQQGRLIEAERDQERSQPAIQVCGEDLAGIEEEQDGMFPGRKP